MATSAAKQSTPKSINVVSFLLQGAAPPKGSLADQSHAGTVATRRTEAPTALLRISPAVSLAGPMGHAAAAMHTTGRLHASARPAPGWRRSLLEGASLADQNNFKIVYPPSDTTCWTNSFKGCSLPSMLPDGDFSCCDPRSGCVGRDSITGITNITNIECY
jgi:hypothetical protein